MHPFNKTMTTVYNVYTSLRNQLVYSNDFGAQSMTASIESSKFVDAGIVNSVCNGHYGSKCDGHDIQYKC